MSHWGGADCQCGHVSVEMCAKMKELGPIGGGAHAGSPPLDPPLLLLTFVLVKMLTNLKKWAILSSKIRNETYVDKDLTFQNLP